MKALYSLWRAAGATALVLLLFVVAGCGGGGDGGGGAVLPLASSGTGAGTGTPAQQPSGGRVVSQSIRSAKNNTTYDITIFIPASYDASSERYPTIYALDGDAMFNLSQTRFNNFKSILEKRGTKAILVGIGGTARRQEDYNLPGAIAYHDFLTLELVPFVESQFRADPKTRMLSGLSTSGNLPATALFLFRIRSPTPASMQVYRAGRGGCARRRCSLTVRSRKPGADSESMAQSPALANQAHVRSARSPFRGFG